MKRCFLMICVLFWHVGSANNDLALQQLHAAHTGVTYFEARFEQRRHVKFIAKPLVSNGVILFSPDLGLVWQVNQPLSVKTVINQSGVFKSTQGGPLNKVKDPQIKIIADILSELLSAELDQVNSQFLIEPVNDAKQNDHWQVKLKPKNTLMKKAIQSIDIQGVLQNDQAHSIDTIVIKNQSGDDTVIQFTGVVLSMKALSEQQRGVFE